MVALRALRRVVVTAWQESRALRGAGTQNDGGDLMGFRPFGNEQTHGMLLQPRRSHIVDERWAGVDTPLRPATNRSARHVWRMFASELGMPPHQYLMRRCVEKAQTLLAKTGVSIAETAFDCGFHIKSICSNCFAVSPRQHPQPIVAKCGIDQWERDDASR